MRKITRSFLFLTDDLLDVKTAAIIAAMTASPYFPAGPELAAVETSYSSYALALAAARGGGKTIMAVKNQRRADLVKALLNLANFVTLGSAGDETKLISSNFELSKQRSPLPPIEKAEIISLVNGINSGELQATIRRVVGARLYQYQYTKDPLTAASLWEGQSSTLIRTVFTGLEPGTLYWFRVVAYGVNDQEVFGDAMGRMVI